MEVIVKEGPDKQGVPKPGNQNHYSTKTQGKRVVGESIQTESTTRNPVKHITILNKEFTRLGTTGGEMKKHTRLTGHELEHGKQARPKYRTQETGIRALRT